MFRYIIHLKMQFTLKKESLDVEDSVIVGDPDVSNDKIKKCIFSDFVFGQLSAEGGDVNERRLASLIDGVSGNFETFETVCEKARKLGASLLRIGILPGETVTIASENRLEYSVVLLASVFAGTVLAPINPTYGSDEIVHILNITKPRIIFCSALTYKNITVSMKRLKGVRSEIVLFDDVVCEPSLTPLLKYGALLEIKPLERHHQSNDEEVAVILTSSGTTGLPKGVMLSYSNLKYFCSYFESNTFKNLQDDTAILGLLPLFHGYGYALILASLIFRIKVILLPKFEEKLFLSSIQKHKITNLYLVPPLMVFLAKHPLVMQYDVSSVREIVCGAAPLGPEITAQVQARLPHVDIRQGYGMTEASVIATISPPRASKSHSVGKLAAGLEAKVVDVETGKIVKRGECGEILIRGACVMLGYCGDAEATRQAVDAEGWLHTGDVGYIDHEGFFYIVDRIKELIKYKGYQVAPAELESHLLGLAGIKDTAVVGRKDLMAGELPVAFVVLQPESTLTDSEIINYINAKVSPHKRLRGVKFIELIPRNPSGKILRRILRESLNSKL